MHPDVLEQLFREHYNSALLYALSLAKDRSTAEELVSTAFYKALKSDDKEIVSFKSWLLTVVRNTFLSQARKWWRQAELSEHLHDDGEELLEKIIKDEEYRALYHALSLLPPLQNEMITLFYFENLSMREIAKVVKKSESNVKTTLCRARMKLKELLEGEI